MLQGGQVKFHFRKVEDLIKKLFFENVIFWPNLQQID